MCSFGSSGASAPTTQFTTQTTTADPRAQAMYGQAFTTAQQAANRPFTPYSYDPNAFVAPLNPVQLQGIGNIAGYQGAADPYYQFAGGLAGSAGTATTPGMVSQYMSPYMSQVIDPTRQAIEQQQGLQRSQQQAEQIKAGAFGQERGQLMRAVLAGQQNLGLGQALAPLYQTGYGQALQGAQTDLARQLQASQVLGGLGSGYQQAGLQGAQALLGAGTLGQQTQQAGLQSLFNQYMLQQQYPFMASQFLTQAAAGLGPGYGGTTSGYQQSMQPLSYFGNPLSDRRLKEGTEGEEPEVIGETHDGQKIYRYRLINPETGELGPVQIGLMADEVGERKPEALGDYKGFQTVDYEKATEDAARLGGGVTGRGDYADGGEVDEFGDILKSQQEALEKAGASTSGIFQPQAITPTKLESPALSYQAPERKEQGSLAQGLQSALGLVKTGKEAAGMASGLGGLLSGLGSAAPGFFSTLASLLPAGLAMLSDPTLKTGVRPKAADGRAIAPDDQGLDYLARTLVREAGGEGEQGMEAVADVIRNRLQSGRYGSSLQDVVTAPKQFSPWNPEARGTRADPRLVNTSSDLYKSALGIGQRVMGGAEDITGGATHFYNPELAQPKWGEGLQDAQMIGHHRFGRADAGARSAGLDLKSLPAEYRSFQASAAPQEGSTVSLGGVKPAAEGLSGFIRGTAPEGAGEKALDFATSERFIVPLLTGLGAMASSGSRFLAPAVLQGLGAGAKAYMEVPKIQAETQKIAEEAKVQAQEALAKKALTGKIGVETQRLATELYEKQWIPNVGWVVYDKSKPYSTPRRITDAEGNQIGAIHPKDVPSAAGAMAPEPAKGEPKVASALDWKPTLKAPEGTQIPGALNIALSGDLPKQQEAAKAQVEALRNKAQSAFDQQFRLDEMERQFRDLPERGFLQPGSYAGLRTQLAKEANTFITALGAKPLFDPSNVAAAEELGKDTTRLGFDVSKALGREPGFIVQSAVAANPGMENTAVGFQRITAGLKEAAKYEQDRLAFYEDYAARFGTLTGADKLFRELNPPQAYSRRAILSTIDPEDLQLIRSVPKSEVRKNESEIDSRYGKGVTRLILGEE